MIHENKNNKLKEKYAISGNKIKFFNVRGNVAQYLLNYNFNQ